MATMAMSEFRHMTTSYSYRDFFTVYTPGPAEDCCPSKVNVLVETIGYFCVPSILLVRGSTGKIQCREDDA